MDQDRDQKYGQDEQDEHDLILDHNLQHPVYPVRAVCSFMLNKDKRTSYEDGRTNRPNSLGAELW